MTGLNHPYRRVAGWLTGGAKATGAVEVPATSATSRVGLREGLAAQAGIPRNMVEAPANVWGKSIDDLQ